MEPTLEQQKIIDFHYGKAVVGACAGSGKTATLVNRTKSLPPSETKLIMAFNKKAATEFESRLDKSPLSQVRTIHSFCLKEIRSNPIGYGFSFNPILNTENQFRKICIANDAPREWQSWDDADKFWDKVYFEHAERNLFTNELEKEIIKLRDNQERSDDDSMELNTLKAVWRYRKFLKECNMITFDSMVRVVSENSQNLRKCADHLMIDEYQDVDRFQFKIIVELSSNEAVKSVVVVGDHNQRIYEWRGALSDAFRDFKLNFSDAHNFYLTKNFRSFDEILNYANDFCIPKMTGSKGSDPSSVIFGDYQDLVSGLNKDYSSATILCRYNRECAHWKLKLTRLGFPVFVMGGGDFWALPHAKLAKKLWKQKITFEKALESNEWKKLTGKKYYQDNEAKMKEIEEDLKFIIELSHSDMRILEDNLQNEREGIKISTIHKTKGLEFDRVMVYSVSESLMEEVCLFYVATTRPRKLLVLN